MCLNFSLWIWKSLVVNYVKLQPTCETYYIIPYLIKTVLSVMSYNKTLFAPWKNYTINCLKNLICLGLLLPQRVYLEIQLINSWNALC